MNKKISFEIKMEDGYDGAFEKLSKALKSEGFGILTQIDVKKTLKDKLNVDFRQYSILGVCNPKLAHSALSHNAESGLLLPCNVTVEKDSETKTTIRIIDPVKMLGLGEMGKDEVLKKVGKEAQEKLLRVIDILRR